MTYGYHVIVGSMLLVLQGTVIQLSPFLRNNFYDLMIPFVVYLALFRPRRDSVFVVVMLGLIIDSLSGAPFGMFTTAYFWLFMSLKWITQYLHASNTLLIPVVVALGVFMENLFFVTIIATFVSTDSFLPQAFQSIGAQFLWALFTGPFFLLALYNTNLRWDRWVRSHARFRNGTGA